VKPDPGTRGAATRSRPLLSSAFRLTGLARPDTGYRRVRAPFPVRRGTGRHDTGARSLGARSLAAGSPSTSRTHRGPIPGLVRPGPGRTRRGSIPQGSTHQGSTHQGSTHLVLTRQALTSRAHTRRDRASADRTDPALPTRSFLARLPASPVGGGQRPWRPGLRSRTPDNRVPGRPLPGSRDPVSSLPGSRDPVSSLPGSRRRVSSGMPSLVPDRFRRATAGGRPVPGSPGHQGDRSTRAITARARGAPDWPGRKSGTILGSGVRGGGRRGAGARAPSTVTGCSRRRRSSHRAAWSTRQTAAKQAAARNSRALTGPSAPGLVTAPPRDLAATRPPDRQDPTTALKDGPGSPVATASPARGTRRTSPSVVPPHRAAPSSTRPLARPAFPRGTDPCLATSSAPPGRPRLIRVTVLAARGSGKEVAPALSRRHRDTTKVPVPVPVRTVTSRRASRGQAALCPLGTRRPGIPRRGTPNPGIRHRVVRRHGGHLRLASTAAAATRTRPVALDRMGTTRARTVTQVRTAIRGRRVSRDQPGLEAGTHTRKETATRVSLITAEPALPGQTTTGPRAATRIQDPLGTTAPSMAATTRT
jgi:hypothetical protein